ncbi:MAG TPA: nuclear transport factor 2 family protein [Solirubrobacterales bacterium]|nr:nuclear transport factor 2 family protein [Solirubrobacterales bacterium]
MSQESIEVIKRAYDAWHRSGLNAFTEHWAEDVRWRSIEGAPDDRGPMEGRAAVRAYIQDWDDTFDEFHVDPVELTPADERTVVATLRYGGRAKHSGVELPGTPFAAVFVVSDGRIAACSEYETRSQALDAAGLPS